MLRAPHIDPTSIVAFKNDIMIRANKTTGVHLLSTPRDITGKYGSLDFAYKSDSAMDEVHSRVDTLVRYIAVQVELLNPLPGEAEIVGKLALRTTMDERCVVKAASVREVFKDVWDRAATIKNSRGVIELLDKKNKDLIGVDPNWRLDDGILRKFANGAGESRSKELVFSFFVATGTYTPTAAGFF